MSILRNQSLWALLIGGALLTTTACKKDDDNDDTTETPGPTLFNVSDGDAGIKVVQGTTTTDYTFTSDKKWLLKGFVYVESGATLTIQPGTIIKGDKDTKGTLI